MKTIFRTKFGSHLYGTDTPLSDLDYKSVYLPDASDILLQRVKGSLGNKKSKVAGERNSPEDVDDESYSLQRYLGLLAEGQTVAIDMLFAPNPEIDSFLWYTTIKANKEKLLTTKSASFVGYVRTQANKYGIRGSRVKAAKEASQVFSTIYSNSPQGKVGDFESLLTEMTGEFTKIVTKETTPGKFETYFECCNRMVGFKNTLKEAAGIYTRIY